MLFCGSRYKNKNNDQEEHYLKSATSINVS